MQANNDSIKMKSRHFYPLSLLTMVWLPYCNIIQPIAGCANLSCMWLVKSLMKKTIHHKKYRLLTIYSNTHTNECLITNKTSPSLIKLAFFIGDTQFFIDLIQAFLLIILRKVCMIFNNDTLLASHPHLFITCKIMVKSFVMLDVH